MRISYLIEFGYILKEACTGPVCKYLNYKKAEWILNEYNNHLTSFPDERTLEALAVILEYEETRKNRRDMKNRFKKIKKTA